MDGQSGAADVRVAFAEQRDRARAQRAAADSGGVPRRGLHRAGGHAPERVARAGRNLPSQPRTPRQKEQGPEERHLLQPLRGRSTNSRSSSARRTSTSRRTSTRRRSLRARWPTRLARAKRWSRPPTGTRPNCWRKDAACWCRSATPRPSRAKSSACCATTPRRHAMRKNAYKLGREMVWSNVARLYMRSFELARLEGAVLSRKSFATKTLDQQPRGVAGAEAGSSVADDRFDRASSSTPCSPCRIFPKATARTTTRAPSFWRCCSTSWRKNRSACGRWPRRTRRFCITRSIPRRSGFTTT